HLRPGGRVHVWVYGREGNEWLLRFVDPVRKRLTSRLPPAVLRVAALALAAPLHLALRVLYRRRSGARLPYGAYLSWLARFPFPHTQQVVFDHLSAPIAHYYPRDEFRGWFEKARLGDIVVSARNANRWRAAAAGRLPDIASVDSFWMPLFMAGGHVQALNAWWPEADRADFLPFTIQTLSDGAGNVYGVWHGTDCRVLYYRKDLLPAPPRTWAELLEDAGRISRERRIAGYLYNAGRWEG